MLTKEDLEKLGFHKEMSGWREYYVNDVFSISTIYFPEHLRFFVIGTKEDLGEFTTIEELKTLMKKGYTSISEKYKEKSEVYRVLSDMYKTEADNVDSKG